MSGKTRTSTDKRALLLIPRRDLEYLDEALALAQTAGYEIAGVIKLRDSRRIRKGLLERVSYEVEDLDAGTIIFYSEPPPTTIYLLQRETKRKVIDRVSLILEIFLLHAGSREAKLQIEAAMIRHMLPILREYVRRAKMGELPGFLGPGEYAIDKYRLSLERKLSRIRRQLEDLRKRRTRRLEERKRRGMAHASIVGYASAGKTTLFNAITGEDKPVGEEYFTTLHPKHKAVIVEGEKIVFVDTVGFIRRVPHEIIEAFKSTLEEVAYSDAIIFVVDSSEPDREIREKVEAGLETLANIGAAGLEGRLLVAANKIDLLDKETLHYKLDLLRNILGEYVHGTPVIPVSASRGYGIDVLLKTVSRMVKVGRSEAIRWLP